MNTVTVDADSIARVLASTARLQAILDHIAVNNRMLPRSVFTAIEESVAATTALRSQAGRPTLPGPAAVASFAAGCLVGAALKR